jgi:hypothetical protein
MFIADLILCYVAYTFGWVLVIIIGVPGTIQIEVEDQSTSDCPMENTRTEPVSHNPTTHGTGTPATLKGQPEIT